jgi:uncharacterized protein YyaL (SSP411 family)
MPRVRHRHALLNMFDLNLAVPAARDLPDAKIFARTTGHVRQWLETKPNAHEIAAHVPALELALAAHVKNQDPSLLALVRDAVARARAELALENMALDALASWITLNTQLFQFTRATQDQDAARRWTKHGAARFDETRGMFRTDARDEANVFCTDANARMAEAFYLAWRVLDDQTLRPLAGEVLGQVSDAFTVGEGLPARVHLPDGVRSDTRNAATYAAALQMFLTATETTGRGTYVSRARILADFVLAKGLAETNRLAFDTRAQMADALTRLFQFTHADAYQEAADALLRETEDVPSDIDAAHFALAVEHAVDFPLHIVIIGDAGGDENAQALWNVALNAYASARAIEVLDLRQHAARIEMLGYMHDEGAIAYVCRGPVCLPPVRSAEQLSEILGSAIGFSEFRIPNSDYANF